MGTLQLTGNSETSQEIILHFLEDNEHLLPDPLSKHISLNDYSEKLNRFGVTFVFQEDGQVLGIVSGYINDYSTKEAFLQVIIVSANVQGHGIGKSLIDSFVLCAKERFTSGKVFLTVDKSNTNAYRIYTEYGFMNSQKVHPNSQKQIMEFVF